MYEICVMKLIKCNVIIKAIKCMAINENMSNDNQFCVMITMTNENNDQYVINEMGK